MHKKSLHVLTLISAVLGFGAVLVGIWFGIAFYNDRQYANALEHQVDHYACVDTQGGAAAMAVIHSLPADAASRYYACYAYDAQAQLLEQQKAPNGLVSFFEVSPKGKPAVSVL